jgi:hypothetical protein
MQALKTSDSRAKTGRYFLESFTLRVYSFEQFFASKCRARQSLAAPMAASNEAREGSHPTRKRSGLEILILAQFTSNQSGLNLKYSGVPRFVQGCAPLPAIFGAAMQNLNCLKQFKFRAIPHQRMAPDPT